MEINLSDVVVNFDNDVHESDDGDVDIGLDDDGDIDDDVTMLRKAT